MTDIAEFFYSAMYRLVEGDLTPEQLRAAQDYERQTYITKDVLDQAHQTPDGGLGETAIALGPEAAMSEANTWFDDLSDWYLHLDTLTAEFTEPGSHIKRSKAAGMYLEQAAGDWYRALHAVRRAAVHHWLGTAGPRPSMEGGALDVGGIFIPLQGDIAAEHYGQ